jgi:hypothetical protein
MKLMKPLALLASFGLVAGSLAISPQASADLVPLVQDQPKSRTITIKGTALNPDGTPAAKLAVVILTPNKQLVGTGGAGGGGGGQAPPPELLQARGGKQANDFIELAKGVTDDSGKFSIKFDHRDAKSFQVQIGDKMETAWLNHTMENKGKDIDLGNIQLRAKVRG